MTSITQGARNVARSNTPRMPSIKEHTATYYPRHPSDVRDAAASLTKLFHDLHVPHLVDIILNYAEYWLKIEKTRHDKSHIESWNFGPFLATPPIPSRSKSTISTSKSLVRKVRWTVWALDAEWRFDRQRTDGKAWSYWVATKALNKDSVSRWQSRQSTEQSEECDCGTPRKMSLPTGILSGEDEDSVKSEVLEDGLDLASCTRWGHRSLSTYSVLREDWLKMPQLESTSKETAERFAGKNVFSNDDDVLAVPLEDWEEGPEVARLCQKIKRRQEFQFECSVYEDGAIAEWIRGLQGGDRVALTSKAPFNARECHTEGAKIEVFYSWLPE